MVSLTSCLGCTQSRAERFLGHCDAVRFVYCDEEYYGKNGLDSNEEATATTGHLITCAADKTTRIWSISNIKEDNAITALSSRQLASPSSPTSPMVSVVILPGTATSHRSIQFSAGDKKNIQDIWHYWHYSLISRVPKKGKK